MIERDEAAPYYSRYIDLVPREVEICAFLQQQGEELTSFFSGISEAQSASRYQPDKWSIREVLGHINDCERLFEHRAFWFARGFDSELPSFEQETAAAQAQAHDRSWQSHVEEFQAVRLATLQLFRNLPAAAWMRRGIASENPFTVRAMAWIIAGHPIHHTRVLRERYGV